MECKGTINTVEQKLNSIKVEPYWNVKGTQRAEYTNILLIKVEPYWNVKELSLNANQYIGIKVEPYWNVKLLYSIHFQSTEYY